MDKGDPCTFIRGFVVILVIAVIVNHGTLSKVPLLPFSGSTQAMLATEVTSPRITGVIPLPTTQIPEVNQTPRPPDAPYQITYTNNPFSYPAIHLPKHMETFGASDISLG